MKHIITLGAGLALGGVAGFLFGVFAAAWMIGAATRKSMKRPPFPEAPYKYEPAQPRRPSTGDHWHPGKTTVYS